jgi:Tol biopolymer transport system component
MSGAATLSPDGSQIAYQRLRSAIGAHEIWLMGSHGDLPHKILTAENGATITGIAWSPTGERIAYNHARWQGDQVSFRVQSCDLGGANKTMILQDNHLRAFTWISSGRFLYSRNTETGSAESDNLWELRVDEKKGTPQGKAQQLTDWSGFSVSGFSATRDGKQVAFVRGTEHASVFVGDLTNDESRLVKSRRLTLDDNYNIPLAWTPDSREVIFSSQRAGIRMMYRLALDQGSSPQSISPPGDTNFYVGSVESRWSLDPPGRPVQRLAQNGHLSSRPAGRRSSAIV